MRTVPTASTTTAPCGSFWYVPLRLSSLGPPRVAVPRVLSALSFAALCLRLVLDSGIKDVDVLVDVVAGLVLFPTALFLTVLLLGYGAAWAFNVALRAGKWLWAFHSAPWKAIFDAARNNFPRGGGFPA